VVDYWEKIAPYYDLGQNEEDIMVEIKFLENAFNEIAQREIKTVLDVCCGTGVWSIPLANKGFTVIGIDEHKKMLEIAEKKAKEQNLKIDFKEGDMRDIPVMKKVDAILVSNGIYLLLSHNEILEAFSGFLNHLEESGVLIFNLPNSIGREHLDHEIETFQGKNAYRMEIRKLIDTDEVKAITHEEWTSIVNDRGKLCMISGEVKTKILSYEEIRTLLLNSGFTKDKIHCYSSYEAREEVKDKAEDLIFVVIK
jgi:2-polyprenyl-3-methyl-5-hydroxy-6-metoxy-1,4-benzoquinol methylase